MSDENILKIDTGIGVKNTTVDTVRGSIKKNTDFAKDKLLPFVSENDVILKTSMPKLVYQQIKLV